MKKNVAAALKITSTVLTGIVLILAILLVGVKLFGLEVYTVLSGSMEPEYPTGSLIYVKETDPEELEIGDVITYELVGYNVATHRIIAINEENGELVFTTKGDANEVADNSPVSGDRIVGKVVFQIRGLGRFANFVQSAAGTVVTVSVGALIVLLMVAEDYLSDDRKGDSKKRRGIF